VKLHFTARSLGEQFWRGEDGGQVLMQEVHQITLVRKIFGLDFFSMSFVGFEIGRS